MDFSGLAPADILLPAPGVDLEKWAVVACDQYTADPAYWQRVEQHVGDAPSTLRLIYPEIYLEQGLGRIPEIQGAMRRYLREGVLRTAVSQGFAFIRRVTQSGPRPGLMAALDLECYDYRPGSASLARATEGTILSRIPPRMKIRTGAALESPHVMLLLDDPGDTVLGPLERACAGKAPLYDTPLMEGGGQITGWAVTEEALTAGLAQALSALRAQSGGLLYAVGDGNHSLATAKACWEARKKALSPAAQAQDPARYALVELVNLHAPALRFEPIHRVLFHSRGPELLQAFEGWLAARGWAAAPGNEIVFVQDGWEAGVSLAGTQGLLPVSVLQAFLDEFPASRPGAALDYIHGEPDVRALARGENVGMLLQGMKKSALFPGIRAGGVLPRKTFSMGHAWEKRYYMECRRLAPQETKKT